MKPKIIRTLQALRPIEGVSGKYGIKADPDVTDEICSAVVGHLEHEGILPSGGAEGGCGPASRGAAEPEEHTLRISGEDYYVWTFKGQVEIYRLG